MILQRIIGFHRLTPPPQNRKYDHFSHVSFPVYFLQLLELQVIDWLRLPLWKGFATSTIVGAEGLIRASRLALVQCINAKEAKQQQAMLLMIVQDLSTILSDSLQDDRYAVPIMELLAFLIDGYIPSIPEGSESLSVPPVSLLCINLSRDYLTHLPLVFEKYLSSSRKRILNHPTYNDLKLQSKSTRHYQDFHNYDSKSSKS